MGGWDTPFLSVVYMIMGGGEGIETTGGRVASTPNTILWDCGLAWLGSNSTRCAGHPQHIILGG
jgi:hypothetical protein